MGLKLTTYDQPQSLDSDEAIAVFVEEAFKSEDADYIVHAVGVVARAKGMTQIANEAGISRKQLYRAFSGEWQSNAETRHCCDEGTRYQADGEGSHLARLHGNGAALLFLLFRRRCAAICDLLPVSAYQIGVGG